MSTFLEPFKNNLLNAANNALAILQGQIQDNSILQITFPNGDGPEGYVFVVHTLESSAGLSRNYETKVTLFSNNPDIEAKSLMYKLVVVKMVRADGSLRYFGGQVWSFRFDSNDSGLATYEMTLRSPLAFLEKKKNHYIFHDMTIEEQTTYILRNYPDVKWRALSFGADPSRPDSFQFGETDLNYLLRRWIEVGVFFYHEQNADGPVLVLGRDSTIAAPIDGGGKISWQGKSGVRDVGMHKFSEVRTITPTSLKLTSFDFKAARPRTVTLPSINKQGNVPKFEIYDYVGAFGFSDLKSADALARQRIEAIEAQAKHFEGVTDDDHVEVGYSFGLTGHQDVLAALTQDGHSKNTFLIVETVESIRNNWQLLGGSKDGSEPVYSAQIVCIRVHIPWRPLQDFQCYRPIAHGLQSAIVVTDGEEILTDKYGRHRVQFHWDQVGGFNRGSSAYIRMAAPVAGDRFGQIAPLRARQEVLVAFLDGNPDRPVIIGSVHNQDNMPNEFNGAGNWPANAALSGWSTREIGGASLQQLVLNDTQGKPSAQLSSDFACSRLTVGYLGTTMLNGAFSPRGEGIELRSKASAVLRGEQGVFISADQLPGDNSPALARAPLEGLVDVLRNIQQQLGKLAVTHQTEAVNSKNLNNFIDRLAKWENGSNTHPDEVGGLSPMVVTTAPSTVAIAAGDNLLLGAQTNVDVVSAQNIQAAAGNNILIHAGEGYSVYSQGKGIKMVAGNNSFEIEAHNGDLSLVAAKALILRAGEEVRIEAPKHTFVAQGAQIDIGGGQITQQSSGSHVIKSSSFAQVGPGGGSPQGLQLPTTTIDSDEKYILRSRGSGLPAANRRYRIEMSNGTPLEGKTDDEGRTLLAQSQAINIAQLTILDN